MSKQQEIRICQKHGETLFALRSNGKKGSYWKCLKCETEAVQKRREKLKAMAIAYKGGKCQICGYDKCVGALEFHHIDPTQKDFGISAKGYTRSWDKNRQELDKCVLVCANCHREIHAGITKCPSEVISNNIAAQEAADKFEKDYLL